MQDINFPLTADGGPDDLPRTLRRERDRQARERDPSSLGAAGYPAAETAYGAALNAPIRAAVTRFDVSFARLMMFFIKAVFAAIPALLLLGGILWSIGFLLQKFFPQLIKMQILIWFPS